MREVSRGFLVDEESLECDRSPIDLNVPDARSSLTQATETGLSEDPKEGVGACCLTSPLPAIDVSVRVLLRGAVAPRRNRVFGLLLEYYVGRTRRVLGRGKARIPKFNQGRF